MLSVKVDQADPTDLHEQVAAEIRRAIADGEAQPGDRLPPARDLAAVIGVNTNTVLRALRTPGRRPARVSSWPRDHRHGQRRTRRGCHPRTRADPLRSPARLQPQRTHPNHRTHLLTATRVGRAQHAHARIASLRVLRTGHAGDVGQPPSDLERDRGFVPAAFVERWPGGSPANGRLSVVCWRQSGSDANRCHLGGAVRSRRWMQALARMRRKCLSAMFAVRSAAWRNDVAASWSRPRRARRSPRTAWRRW